MRSTSQIEPPSGLAGVGRSWPRDHRLVRFNPPPCFGLRHPLHVIHRMALLWSSTLLGILLACRPYAEAVRGDTKIAHMMLLTRSKS